MGSFGGPAGVSSFIPKHFPVPVSFRPRPGEKARVTPFSSSRKNLVIGKATGSQSSLAVFTGAPPPPSESRFPKPSRHLKTFSKKIDWALKFLEKLSDIPNAAREPDLRATPSPG
jgi:hypothetical protein